MKYYELVEKHSDKVDFKFMIVINNATMQKTYHILSNMYCDPVCFTDDWLSTGNYNQKEYRKEVSILKKLLKKRVALVATNNDAYHTRLIYKLIDIKG